MLQEEPYGQKLLIPKAGEHFLITGKDCLPQTGHNDCKLCMEKDLGYFVIVNGLEVCKIWVAPGSRIYMF